MNAPDRSLQSLATPAALLDETCLQHNIARMQQRMDALGVRLRPHVKTAKCVEVARRQLAAGAHGITVSTLKEAEVFFDAGFTDILYAVCIAPSKLAQGSCPAIGPRIHASLLIWVTAMRNATI